MRQRALHQLLQGMTFFSSMFSWHRKASGNIYPARGRMSPWSFSKSTLHKVILTKVTKRDRIINFGQNDLKQSLYKNGLLFEPRGRFSTWFTIGPEGNKNANNNFPLSSSGIEDNPTVFYQLIRGSTEQTNKYDTFYLQQRQENGWTYADVKVFSMTRYLVL